MIRCLIYVDPQKGSQTKGWADRLQELPLLRTQLLYSPHPGELQLMTQVQTAPPRGKLTSQAPLQPAPFYLQSAATKVFVHHPFFFKSFIPGGKVCAGRLGETYRCGAGCRSCCAPRRSHAPRVRKASWQEVGGRKAFAG